MVEEAIGDRRGAMGYRGIVNSEWWIVNSGWKSGYGRGAMGDGKYCSYMMR